MFCNDIEMIGSGCVRTLTDMNNGDAIMQVQLYGNMVVSPSLDRTSEFAVRYYDSVDGKDTGVSFEKNIVGNYVYRVFQREGSLGNKYISYLKLFDTLDEIPDKFKTMALKAKYAFDVCYNETKSMSAV